VGSPRAMASAARRRIAVAEAYCSRQPWFPQPQGRPSGITVVWPTSPAMPATPCQGRPWTNKPPPTPVPKVSMQRSSTPCPAPTHAISIVLQDNRHAQSSLKILHHGIIVPAREIGSRAKDSVGKINNPRNSYSNAKKRVRGGMAPNQASNRRGHFLDDGLTRPLRPLVNGLEFAACRVNRGDSQVRSSQVDTNGELHWTHPGRWPGLPSRGLKSHGCSAGIEL